MMVVLRMMLDHCCIPIAVISNFILYNIYTPRETSRSFVKYVVLKKRGRDISGIHSKRIYYT